jgi:hypothetical protein
MERGKDIYKHGNVWRIRCAGPGIIRYTKNIKSNEKEVRAIAPTSWFSWWS